MALISLGYVYGEGSPVTRRLVGETEADIPASGLQPGELVSSQNGRAWVAKTATLLNELASYDGVFAFRGHLTPAQITADQNDYSPPGMGTTAVLRLDSDAARSITGIAPGAGTGNGRILYIFNVGAFNITLTNEDVASIAANRFALTANRVLTPNDGCLIWYDATSSRWRLVN